MEFRVEELAARSGVRVDTLRFYQARGLLPAPERVGRVAVYGDMGATTDEFRGVAPSIPVLQQDQQDGLFDGVIHAGDYAYDFAPYGGRVGDRFMNLVRGA